MEQKKPGAAGARDLTDLRAKLGLVKPGAAPAGMPMPGAPAAPRQPPAPDPTRDPFARVAPRSAATAQPAAVITDAGPLVAVPEMKKSSLPRVIGAVVGVAAALGAGFGYGVVHRARLLHNQAIGDAQQIKEEVTAIRKRSQVLYNALNTSFERAKQQRRDPFGPDLALVEDLKAVLPLAPPKTDKIFKTNYVMLENITIDRLFNYYNNTIRMYAAVERFVRQSENAADALKKVIEKKAEDQGTYGVVIDAAGDIPLGMLVEVGAPICADPDDPACGSVAADVVGFNVRADVVGRWTTRKLVGHDGERVIPLDPQRGLASKVLAGGLEMMAAENYRQQITELRVLANQLVAIEKDLVDELTKSAGRRKVFAFGG